MMPLRMTTSVVMTMMLFDLELRHWYFKVVPVDYCATIGEVWLEKGRCISSVVDRSPPLPHPHHRPPHHQKSSSHPPFLLTLNYALRSLMEIPGLDPVREHFNLFPGTRESCVQLLKWPLSFFSFSLRRRNIYLNLKGTVRCWG